MTSTPVTDSLNLQLTEHWTHILRPRLDGLTTEEYLWEPVPGCWNVRPRGTSDAPVQGGSGDFVVDFDMDEPTPPPVTTIAWRMVHLTVGVFGLRNQTYFDGPEADYMTWPVANNADSALAQLDEAYDWWASHVSRLDEEGLSASCGREPGEFASWPMASLVLHINREVIHHGAEIALLRDLYAHWPAG